LVDCDREGASELETEPGSEAENLDWVVKTCLGLLSEDEEWSTESIDCEG